MWRSEAILNDGCWAYFERGTQVIRRLSIFYAPYGRTQILTGLGGRMAPCSIWDASDRASCRPDFTYTVNQKQRQ